jgi:hypothetical protein
LRLLRRLAVLRKLLEFGFEFGLPRRNLFGQLLNRVARACQFFDAQ